MIGAAVRTRVAATGTLFAAVFAILAVRAVQLTVIQGPSLRELADRQHRQRVALQPRRGAIVDRFGEPLALTRESMDVYVRPREFVAGADAVTAVARRLDLAPERVAERLRHPSPFVWLGRQVALDRWSALEELGIEGIGGEPARQRVYPQGALAGHVLGFVGIDGQGLEGVERVLDRDLRGEVEALEVERDARGRRIAVDGVWRPLPRAGALVQLTIDAGLQRVAEEELERAVSEFGAAGGSAVVLVPDTGEVLAMANVSRFDPNRFSSASPAEWRNRAITDCYEPGSTFKAILAAEALEAGVVHPEYKIFCENGRYAIGGRVIRDHHGHGTLSFADVIAQSSNIGCAKVAERLGPERFAAAITRFGFGQPTAVDLPGEVGGLVRPVSSWRKINLATTAFGQGIAVTPLQLARAFGAIANGGRLMRPFVVRRLTAEDGTVRDVGRPQVDGQVISPATAATLSSLLVRVTEVGTGKLGRVDGFAVAGKTGTAQKVDPATGRYHPRARMSSFVGYVPADHPELVILVVVDTPRKATYGGVVAAPVFKKIAEAGLARRGVRPRLPEAWGPQKPPAAGLHLVAAEPAPEANPEGVPSLIGLGMREALVEARKAGWKVRVEGSGYVIEQDPAPGSEPAEKDLALKFGTRTS